MAIWLNQGEKDGTQASGGCDSTSDVTNLASYAQTHHLKVGSYFLCIDDGKVYMQHSDGSYSKVGG